MVSAALPMVARPALDESSVPSVASKTFLGYSITSLPSFPSRGGAGLLLDGRERRGDALERALFRPDAEAAITS